MKRTIYWVVLLFSMLLIVNVSRSIRDLVKRGSVVEDIKRDLEEARAERNRLSKQLSQIEDPFFVEQQARDKLNLAREGEVVVIVPEITPIVVDEGEQLSPNWKQWLSAFRF